jgi:preprotein translocase subunit SecD
VNRFEILRVVDSPAPNVREVVHKEGDSSETLWVETRPLLGDSDFVRAEMSEIGNSFWINIVLSPVGREKFAEVTRAFVGERLAVFVLGKLVIAPRVVTPIEGGVIQIVGNMSEAEAGRIVKALNRK